MLRTDQAQRDIGTLLWWQLERYPQEVQKYGCSVLRLPLAAWEKKKKFYFVLSGVGIAGKQVYCRWDVMYSIMYIKFYHLIYFPYFLKKINK